MVLQTSENVPCNQARPQLYKNASFRRESANICLSNQTERKTCMPFCVNLLV